MVSKKPTKPYISMAHATRMVLEAKTAQAPTGGPEKDMNDQISVGSYTTKSFEMSDKAQKLFSNLPKGTNVIAAETVCVLLDRMFALQKACEVRGLASHADLEGIDQMSEKALAGAVDMDQTKAITDIIGDVKAAMSKHVKPERVIDPEDHKHPSDDPRFKTSAKDYSTDRKNDRDVDNVKNYLISRNRRAQIKTKIIDD
jgi:hypothetical protein